MELRQAGLEFAHLYEVSVDAMQLCQAGVELARLCGAVFDPMQLRLAGFVAAQLRQAGTSVIQAYLGEAGRTHSNALQP